MGYAIYNLAIATAWILFAAFGTVLLTVSLSSSESIEGITEGVSTNTPDAMIEAVLEVRWEWYTTDGAR